MARPDNLLGIHTKSLQLDQGDMSSKFHSFCWSIGLFPSYVHQGLHCKMERWKEGIKLGWNSEIVDRFLILSQILLGICLIDYVMPFFSLEVYQFIGYLRGFLRLLPL